MRSALAIPLTAAALAALPAAGASAGVDSRTEPWATVNVCDTQSRPNQIGIRGSMPGLARRTRMLMRFRVQYKTREGEWRTVENDVTDSGWLAVAEGRRGEHNAGWTFEFKPPKGGGAHVLRGLVSFQWRRAGHVVMRDRRLTEGGHPGTVGADPASFSAETCLIA